MYDEMTEEATSVCRRTGVQVQALRRGPYKRGALKESLCRMHLIPLLARPAWAGDLQGHPFTTAITGHHSERVANAQLPRR